MRGAVLALLCVFFIPIPGRCAGTGAQLYYTRALSRMLSLPQPAALRYRVNLVASGAQFYVTRDSAGVAEFGFSIGSEITTTTESWNVSQESSELQTSILLGDGTQAITGYPFFNATWAGAYNWLRYGLDGPPPARSAAPIPSALPTASELPIVAFVTAVNEPFYRVEGRGTGTCANGDTAIRVRLIARDNPDKHPLTDALVDTKTLDICELRYGLRYTQLLGVTGSVALQFLNFGGYQVVADEELEFRFRIRGVGKRHVQVQIHYDNFSFNDATPAR